MNPIGGLSNVVYMQPKPNNIRTIGRPKFSSKCMGFNALIPQMSLVRHALPLSFCHQNIRPLSTPSSGDKQSLITAFDHLHAKNIHDGLSPLQRYSRIVAGLTGKLLGTTALFGVSTIGTGLSLMAMGVSPQTILGLGYICLPASFIGALYHAHRFNAGGQTDVQRLRHAYWMHGLMGVAISPSLVMFHQFIPHALITTGALVAGPITAARMMPKGAMLQWGPALYTGLWGLVGVGIASIVAPYFGLHELGTTLHGIDLYGGVALFTVYNAYDTHVMIDQFKKGDKDYVGHAANYSLNSLNLFIRLLEIFSKSSRSSSTKS